MRNQVIVLSSRFSTVFIIFSKSDERSQILILPLTLKFVSSFTLQDPLPVVVFISSFFVMARCAVNYLLGVLCTVYLTFLGRCGSKTYETTKIAIKFRVSRSTAIYQLLNKSTTHYFILMIFSMYLSVFRFVRLSPSVAFIFLLWFINSSIVTNFRAQSFVYAAKLFFILLLSEIVCKAAFNLSCPMFDFKFSWNTDSYDQNQDMCVRHTKAYKG